MHIKILNCRIKLFLNKCEKKNWIINKIFIEINAYIKKKTIYYLKI